MPEMCSVVVKLEAWNEQKVIGKVRIVRGIEVFEPSPQAIEDAVLAWTRRAIAYAQVHGVCTCFTVGVHEDGPGCDHE